MKLSEIWEDFLIRAKHKKPGIITFLIQLAVWIVGGVIITFFAAKEFYERRIKQWRNFKKSKDASIMRQEKN